MNSDIRFNIGDIVQWRTKELISPYPPGPYKVLATDFLGNLQTLHLKDFPQLSIFAHYFELVEKTPSWRFDLDKVES